MKGALTLGGGKQREDVTGEFAVKCTQINAPLAVNTGAKFNHQELDIAVRGHSSYYTGGGLNTGLISSLEFA